LAKTDGPRRPPLESRDACMKVILAIHINQEKVRVNIIISSHTVCVYKSNLCAHEWPKSQYKFTNPETFFYSERWNLTSALGVARLIGFHPVEASMLWDSYSSRRVASGSDEPASRVGTKEIRTHDLACVRSAELSSWWDSVCTTTRRSKARHENSFGARRYERERERRRSADQVTNCTRGRKASRRPRDRWTGR